MSVHPQQASRRPCSDGQRTTLENHLELRLERMGPKEELFHSFSEQLEFSLDLTRMVSEGWRTEVMEKGLRKPLQPFHLG